MLDSILHSIKASKALAPLRDYVRHRRRARYRKICAPIDLGRAGLEIGPSHQAILPKAEGWNVTIMDWTDAEGLRAKYAQLGVDGSRIEPVDYIWKGEPFVQIVGDRRFAWIVASHVIEHTPCLVTFLRDCQSILEPDGVLSLAVPDKRYCFDYFRERSSIARAIDVFHAGTRRPTTGGAADHYLNVVTLDGRMSWRRTQVGRLRNVHSPAEAVAAVSAHMRNDAYLDLHNWVFTPHMMRLLLDDLYRLGYIGLREVGFSPTKDCEFFLALSPVGKRPAIERAALARLAQREAR